ncbi:MAG: hybrid sensor histidine kinase/response regulator [Acidobacteriota bacterium]|nr:hybrid sensor histidine kinase/response regulator [Acidobacteriota bacterium]
MVRVLFVEDDKIDRLAVERMVRKRKLPYRMEIACSSEEAKQRLATNTYDIILLDYLLGDGTGLELLEETGATPVIFVTGAGSEEIAVEAMRNGAYDYLIKDQEGKFLTVLPVTIDSVLERRKAEVALLESEERYRNMAEFADSVIHNAGNVLSSIQTSCEVIKNKISKSKLVQIQKAVPMVSEGFRGELEPEKREQLPLYLQSATEVLQKEHADTVREIGEMLDKLGLVRDIIKNQQTRQRAMTRIEVFHLSELVDETIKVLKPSICGKKITKNIQLDANPLIRHDRSTLTHVLINVVKNAVEAVDEGSGKRVLSIESRAIEGGAVQLTVTDTGVGIDQADMQRIFGHGFTTKKKGHGFGLHYCAHVMKEMGGKIEITSPGAGLGTSVHLVLPPEHGEPSGN